MGILSSIGQFIRPISQAVGAATGMPIIGNIGSSVSDVLTDRRNRRRQDNSIQRLVRDARAAGIHPLAALGSPIAGTNAAPVGSTATGDTVGDAILARRSLEAEIESKRADRDLKREALNQEKLKTNEMILDARNRTAIMAARLKWDQRDKPALLRERYWDPIEKRWFWGPGQQVPDNDTISTMLGMLQFPADSFAPSTSPIPRKPIEYVTPDGKVHRALPPSWY